MSFEQQTFLGASVIGFNSSVGWNSSTSTLTVDLVEDPQNGDSFSPGMIGRPVYFNCGGFSFGGILTSWEKQNNNNGNPTYTVTVSDPRDILSGVQLILDGYMGQVYNVPNVFNVYGYLENKHGFGGSGANSTGIPWTTVANTIVEMTGISSITFKGYYYHVDLTSLPSISSDFRVGGENTTLLDFISEICTSASHDFYVSLVGNIIKIHTIDRSKPALIGGIESYISSKEGASAKTTGIELRNESTSKFLVGGNVQKLYARHKSVDEINKSLIENELKSKWIYDSGVRVAVSKYKTSVESILPYWGRDPNNGNVIFGKGYFESEGYDMVLNSAGLVLETIKTGPYYSTDINEIRAAYGGFDSWCNFIAWAGPIPNNPHTDKHKKFKIISNYKNNVYKYLNDRSLAELSRLTPSDIAGYISSIIINLAENKADNPGVKDIYRIYNFVRSYALDYYGKKFAVRIPFVNRRIDVEAGIIETSLEPADGGYLDESELVNAVNNNLLPIDFHRLMTQDGKIECYAKFSGLNSGRLDVSDLSDNDYIVNSYPGRKEDGVLLTNEDTLFVRCTVDANILFGGFIEGVDPVAIVNLPGCIFQYEPDDAPSGGVFRLMLRSALKQKSTSPDQSNNIIRNIFSSPGADFYNDAYAGIALRPDSIIIPLKDNTTTYGPWYSIGADGKTDYEKDESLVPWNYGNYQLLNLAGNSKVSNYLSNQQESEAGTITFPGLPDRSVGSRLVDNGPSVSDINVSVGKDGVTTTYTMKSWSARPNAYTMQYIERLRKVELTNQKNKRRFKDLYQNTSRLFDKETIQSITKVQFSNLSNRDKNTSTSQLIIGEAKEDSSYVVGAPLYNGLNQVGDNFEQKAFVSWDALFRPFSTNPEASGIAKFENPKESGLIETTYMEMLKDSDISILSYGMSGSGNKDMPESFSDRKNEDNIRSIALKGPLIISGFGFDVNDKPVPNSNPDNPSSSFLEDYKNRPDMWKTGPLDTRWDDERKVWVAGGGTAGIGKHGVLRNDVIAGRSGLIDEYVIESGRSIKTGNTYYAYDVMLPSGAYLPAGTHVVTQSESNGIHVINGAGCWM